MLHRGLERLFRGAEGSSLICAAMPQIAGCVGGGRAGGQVGVGQELHEARNRGFGNRVAVYQRWARKAARAPPTIRVASSV